MADLSQVNIRAVLATLRPGAAYQWMGTPGNDDPDFGHQYSAIGEWRDATTTKPTQQEILDTWPTLQAELEAEQTRQNKREQIDRAVDDPRKFYFIMRGMQILHQRQQAILNQLLILRPAAENAEMDELVTLAAELNDMADG